MGNQSFSDFTYGVGLKINANSFKQVKDDLKKNPPVNEKMLRVMFMEMGRKPSEAQIKQMIKSINDQYK